MKKQWRLKSVDPLAVDQISRQSGCHPVVAAILVNRGITTVSEMRRFLNPSWTQLQAMDRLVDADKAVERIAGAIYQQENILIFGDYDVDGITATTLLLEFLLHAGATVSHYIPDRMTEGYGLAVGHIDTVAVARNATLVITVDCGSDSRDAVSRARKYGIDVIITDHHTISDNMPEAFAVINPCRSDCPSNATYLSGAGVAFFLLIRLRAHLRKQGFWNDHRPQPNLKGYCDLAALGTISDVVPMVHDNRLITRVGLEVLNSRPRIGIQALMDISGNKKPMMDEEDIGYRIGPRLNATGRMARADLGVEILRTRDPAIAEALAKQINELNQTRQTIEREILHYINMYFAESPELLEKKTIVLCHQDWHDGVLGIVASRLAEEFYRPAVLISFREGWGKGSARSIPGINLYQALARCGMYLENFGGHPMAGGVRLRPENYEAFKNAFEEAVTAMNAPQETGPSLDIDCMLDLDMISDSLMDALAALQPFGPDHPEPLFLSRNVIVDFSREAGIGHMRFALTSAGRRRLPPVPAIWFKADMDAARQRFFPEIAYRLRRNHWNGKTNLQIVIEDVRIKT